MRAARPVETSARGGLVMRAIALLVLVASCARPGSGGPAGIDASAEPTPPTFDEGAIARAEDTRRASEIPAAALTSRDVLGRRRSARALSRIADEASVEGLTQLLADEDPETVAWAAYGLGYTCRGREDAHVSMLAARRASIGTAARRAEPARGSGELDPHAAIARAIGHCAGAQSEPVLVSWLRSSGPDAEPALLGLGDLALRRRRLGAEAMTALLDAAAGAPSSAPLDLAFYALSRAEADDAFGRRAADVARRALDRPSDARILAIQTLGRAAAYDPKGAAEALGRVVIGAEGFGPGERAEAARALGALGAHGQAAIADALVELTPAARDAAAVAHASGPSFHVLHTLLGGLDEPPQRAEAALSVLASLRPPPGAAPGPSRRLAELRCAAALSLSRGAYDAEVLTRCDAEGSEIAARARLVAVLRRPLAGRRLEAFRALAASAHVRVRERAIEALGARAEVGDATIPMLASALSSDHAGLVATAASVLHARPDRAMVLAASERRAALDPSAPPPTANPAREFAPELAKALEAALDVRWPEDRFETRIALIEAAASVRLARAADDAARACRDPNPALRERAAKALRALGGACKGAERPVTAAAELKAPLSRPTKVLLSTGVAELSIVLEPELSPVAAARVASLVRSGFYEGTVVHRVVPGFVVQFGDPDGDGYGGSGTPLRCETSPVPFRELDVGVALAGRDTGSSQLFVTLARTPHLDGSYARVGRAEGDWASVAEGDTIVSARLAE